MDEWKSLFVPGATGSEGGSILADEEYKESCRITLEKCERYYAITCGVYGSMVHTAFADARNYHSIYDAMKKDLQEFIDSDSTEEENVEFYERFCDTY